MTPTTTKDECKIGRFLGEFDRLQSQWTENGSAWFMPLRQRAIERFAQLGFPTRKTEAWRFTNLDALAALEFSRPGPEDAARIGEAETAPHRLGDEVAAELVFVNGRYCEALSRIGGQLEGAIVGSLSALASAHRSRVEAWLGQCAAMETRPFLALNAALWRDGGCVLIPAGARIGKPIHMIHLGASAGSPLAVYPRHLFVVGAGASADLIETYAGLDGAPVFTNAATEIAVGANAVARHAKLQREPSEAFHFAALGARLERDARFSTIVFGLGARLAREEAICSLVDQGVELDLNGLNVVDGDRHLDAFTTIDHAEPHCSSRETFKTIVDGQASGVFTGHILVRPGAQKTDAKQSSHGLLLTEDATMHAQPQLEIFADDVRCTHGATVGQLDEKSMFYLRSRGIPEREARAILIGAFASEVLDRLPIECLRGKIGGLLAERFG
ncbi:MAG: FeS cluster assembly protein SufD [candidate division BRC1 bacterium ADurb.BinA364]|nr:MAG: FeS cluster assembly protein SufD [candidate division BRC1 bacterium ADurb.BinA364]